MTGMETIYYNEEDKIKALLVGRSVKSVDGERLILDDGTVLTLIGNWGCGGCSAGNYSLTELNGCPNMIMNVEFDVEDGPDEGYYDVDTSYRIFVYAENQKIKLAQFDGTDGNGYYGSGYWIEVARP